MDLDTALWLRGLVSDPNVVTEDRAAARDTLAELERLRANLDEREQAGDAARQVAARIDAAFSHGVPSGSEDPVTADDWHRVLRYARGAGTERPA